MSAPNLKEIEWAIQELEKGESSFPVYAKLANLYTVRNEMLGLSAAQPQIAAYSGTAVWIVMGIPITTTAPAGTAGAVTAGMMDAAK